MVLKACDVRKYVGDIGPTQTPSYLEQSNIQVTQGFRFSVVISDSPAELRIDEH